MIVERVLLASAARTTSPTDAALVINQHDDFDSRRASIRAVKFVVRITAGSGYQIQFAIQNLHPTSNEWLSLITSSVITTAGSEPRSIQTGLGMPEITSLSSNSILAPDFKFVIAHGDSNSVTYSATGIFYYERN